MPRRLVYAMTWTLVLIGLLSVAPNLQKVGASGTIYIREDGTIDPVTAPISVEYNVTYPWGDMDVYTFTDNITEPLVVRRDYSVINGAGYAIIGDRSEQFIGLHLQGSSATPDDRITAVYIGNLSISDAYVGILVEGGYGVVVSDCRVFDNVEEGIILIDISMQCQIERCEVTRNGDDGIELVGQDVFPYLGCRNNRINNNNVTANGDDGVDIYFAFEGFNWIHDNYIADNEDEGVRIIQSSGNNVQNNTILRNADDGVDFEYTRGNYVQGNLIQDNGEAGVDIDDANRDTITRNQILSNFDGVDLVNFHSGTIFENLIGGNAQYGIEVFGSTDNRIYHNDFVGNGIGHVYSENVVNYWNTSYQPATNGVPTAGGNYWDDYEVHHPGDDADDFSGPNQDAPDSDGIWDAPYVIDGANQDNYPRTTPYLQEPEEPEEPPQYALTVHVYDEDTQANLSEAEVSVYFSSNDTLAAVATTTTDGVATFTLTEDSYYLTVQTAGYEEHTGSQFLLTGELVQDALMTSEPPTKTPTTISCSVSPSTVELPGTVTVEGAITPAVPGVTVTLTYRRPDGTTVDRTVTTGSGGSYSDTYQPATAGSWTVAAAWTGDATHDGATSTPKAFTVEEKAAEDTGGNNLLLYGALGAGGVAVALILFFLFGRKKKYECKVCGRKFDSEDELKEHTAKTH